MIPKLHYISKGNSIKEQLDNIQKACSSGAELVQLQLKGVSEKKYLKIAKEARELTSHYQTRLIVQDYYKVAKEIKADGVHFSDITNYSKTVRDYLYTWQIIGANANTLQECESLLAKEIDYINLGPFSTLDAIRSNLQKPLGLQGFAAIADVLKTTTPLIGFGGITTNNVTEILNTGINGLAVTTAIQQDFNTIKVFNQLLNASSTKEQRHTF